MTSKEHKKPQNHQLGKMEFLAVAIAVCAALVAWAFLSKKQKGKKLPPGPPPMPIVGNLLQVGKNPHHTFADMSKRYGPLMSIRFGSVLNVVVTSPELTKEILLKPGFNTRHSLQSARVHDHEKLSIGFIPVTSKKWRDVRKLSKEHIFANPSLEAAQALRHDKLQLLLDYLHSRCGKEVDVHAAVFTTTLNIMTATLFSTQAAEFESERAREFKELVEGLTNVFGEPNVADFFPLLERFDPQSVKRRADKILGNLIGKVRGHIDRRVEARKANAPRKNDFLETLLDVVEGDEMEMSMGDIEHFLVDLYIGGTGTTSTNIEWAMTELLLHPDKMDKAKEELREVIGDNKFINDSNISRLPYLNAIIKETFRLHPPAPLSFPRGADQDTEIGGYFIPKDTRMLFNLWAMNRDPSIWANPESFEPERFLGTDIDYKGVHIPLIPFGAGRRVCPGIPLAHRIMHAGAAALIHNFEWEFAQGERERNGGVFQGLTLNREAPLKAIPTKP